MNARRWGLAAATLLYLTAIVLLVLLPFPWWPIALAPAVAGEVAYRRWRRSFLRGVPR